MKQVLIIISLIANIGLLAQTTNVPDDNFEQALIDLGLDDILDNYVLTANISGETSLNINTKNISDLTGIEAFTSLNYLYCYSNQLTSLDISANTALTNLDCYSNQLTSLDISANTALIDFNCYDNQLTNLSISANTALIYLDCRSNQITSLNVSANTALTRIWCASNQISNLDLSTNTALTSLQCQSTQLTSLDLSTNTALTFLWCTSIQLTSLDISTNTALTTLWCYDNQLTSLDVSANTALTQLQCQSNQITSLDVSTNTALTYFMCYSNQLTSLDVSANTDLSIFSCDNNQISSLNVSTNTALTMFTCAGNLLTSLDVRNGYNANITSFNARNNDYLICIYVDDNTAGYLSAWQKESTSNYVNNETECNALHTYIPDNNFEQALIDLSCDIGALNDYVPTANISGITSLDINTKSISDLTGIADFTALTSLSCYSNQLTSLNVSANTALTQLQCYSNQLTSLDIRNGNNVSITSFDATSNPDLRCIFVDDKSAGYLSTWSIDGTAFYVNDEAECSAALTVNELTKNSDITVYPNPVKEQFSIQTNRNIEIIKIYNVLGKFVKSYNKQNIYSVSALKPGIYFIYIHCSDETFKQKLVIK